MDAEDRRILIETHTLVKSQSTQIGKLFSAIEGNGQPGLKQKVALLEQSHKECKQDRKEEKAAQPANMSNAIACFAMLVAILSPFIVHFLRG